MSVNKYLSHLLILPEDDAVRQIVNGFILFPSINTARVQVLPAPGGWRPVVDQFVKAYGDSMATYTERHMLLVVDLDGDLDRPNQMLHEIAESVPVNDRVYILGASTECEDLRHRLGSSFEQIGRLLAEECARGGNDSWGSELLMHNAREVERLRDRVYPFLFAKDA